MNRNYDLVRFSQDGDMINCVGVDFINPMESPEGFGKSKEQAFDDYINSIRHGEGKPNKQKDIILFKIGELISDYKFGFDGLIFDLRSEIDNYCDLLNEKENKLKELGFNKQTG